MRAIEIDTPATTSPPREVRMKAGETLYSVATREFGPDAMVASGKEGSVIGYLRSPDGGLFEVIQPAD